MATLKLLACFCIIHTALAKGSESVVQCTPEVMKITVPLDGDRKISYLDRLKEYKPCQPELDGETAVFVLDLQDHYKCGVTRVLHRMTGRRTFYHKVVIEDTAGGRETVTARCTELDKHRTITKRDVKPFPLDFDEPEILNISHTAKGDAPEPVLRAIVKQNGKEVSGEISVTPGTPLTMEVFLNEESAPIYGLLMNYMHVTDTGSQQETIILNGCSIDTYLFDNFVTADGDTLTAKFKAFKFPDTTYVQFKGTVTVCIDKCQGVQCSNGQLGYGRKRRSIASGDSGNVYEVALTTIIKVESLNGDIEGENVFAHMKNLKVLNQHLGEMDGTPATVAEQTPDTLTNEESRLQSSNANILTATCLMIISILILFK